MHCGNEKVVRTGETKNCGFASSVSARSSDTLLGWDRIALKLAMNEVDYIID